MALPFPARAGEADRSKRVLVLHSFHSILTPGYLELDRGLKAGWRAAGGPPVEWDNEYLDLVRFGNPGYQDLIQDLLKRKYGQGWRPVDVVIPVFPAAIKFFLTHGKSILPGVPVVICGQLAGDHQNVPMNPSVTGTVMDILSWDNIPLVLNLHPGTRRIVFVAGSGALDRKIEDLAKAIIKAHPVKAEIAYLNDFSFKDLEGKIAELPQDTVVICLTITRDNRGNPALPRDGVAMVAQAARVPVYSLWENVLGDGIVGGYLIRFEEVARKTGELAARILNGARPESLPTVLVSSIPMFDWRQLKRWGISADRLPPGSIVRFREKTLWEEHGGKIVGVILLLVCQSLLIAALLIQRSRRRRAELEARQRRDELAHVSRVATVGELTSSLTHELNQPLTAIVTNAQAALRFLLREIPDFMEVEGALREIAKDGKRSGEIMHRLRNLLKRSEIDQAPVDLNAVALEIVALAQADFDAAEVSLIHDLARDLPLVMGDRIQLEQVVLNLLANALEATKDLTARVRTVQVITRKEDDGGARLTVQDSGPGLSPEILSRLFEPFFTTKAKGMGLGLAVSKSIIEAHGGRLWAEPIRNGGAAFHLSLPAAGEKEDEPG
ncbi:MAG: ATP-binding protein [Deltaproteobacteria bacterium]|nr:ATP-binding protein [Deltaproteobacteria bacterium]